MKQVGGNPLHPADTVGAAFRQLFRHPLELLVHRWNWKSALFSSLFRGVMLLGVNLSAGLHAATGAMAAEFLYRASTGGFLGALTQVFRAAEPRWAAIALMPVSTYIAGALLHWMRGTPNLRASFAASLIFTIVAALFNLHAMRRGVMLVGAGSKRFSSDMLALPMVLVTFVTSGMGLLPPRKRTGSLE